MNDRKMFPIQTERGAPPHPLLIPWHIAELAYSVYASRYGTSQSLERLAERGGFGPSEMDIFLPDWRDRCQKFHEVWIVVRTMLDLIEVNPMAAEFFGKPLVAQAKEFIESTKW